MVRCRIQLSTSMQHSGTNNMKSRAIIVYSVPPDFAIQIFLFSRQINVISPGSEGVNAQSEFVCEGYLSHVKVILALLQPKIFINNNNSSDSDYSVYGDKSWWQRACQLEK